MAITRSGRPYRVQHEEWQTSNKFAALDPEAAYAIEVVTHRQSQLSKVEADLAEVEADLDKREADFNKRALKAEYDLKRRERDFERRCLAAESDLQEREAKLNQQEVGRQQEYDDKMKALAEQVAQVLTLSIGNLERAQLLDRQLADVRDKEHANRIKTEELEVREAKATLREASQAPLIRVEVLEAREAEVESKEARLTKGLEDLKTRETQISLREEDLNVKEARIEVRPDVAAALRDGVIRAPASGQSTTCTICMIAPVDCEASVCGHARFCYDCIRQWNRSSCPHCRAETGFHRVYF